VSDGSSPISDWAPAQNEFCIEHLKPIHLLVETEARPRGVGILVQFSVHCYTEAAGWLLSSSEAPILLDERRQSRVYCPTRYALSKELPSIMRSIASRKVFITPEKNCMWTGVRPDGIAGEYRVYFNLKKASRIEGTELRLYVESAYAPDGNRALPVNKHQAVRFKVLVDAILSGKPVKFNPKR
jgi:hypothetical protein